MKTTLDILIALCVAVLLLMALAALGCESNATKPDVGLATFDTFDRELVGAVDLAIEGYLDTVSFVPPRGLQAVGWEHPSVKIYDFGGE